MTHLSETEIVDLLDGALAPARGAHAESCAACRARSEGMREALAHAMSVEPADPSPMFWDHLAARVSDAIDRESARRPARLAAWLRRPVFAFAGAAVVVVVLLAAAMISRDTAAPAAPSRAEAVAVEIDAGTRDDIDRDAGWAVVRSAADGLAWEDTKAVTGIAVRPGSAEAAVHELTSEERAELARLLEEEMKRHGA